MGALRVLTGVLIPTITPGSATIHFNPHEVTGDANGIEMNQMGAAGDFESAPGKTVSLRQLTVSDKALYFGGPEPELDIFTVNDSAPTADHMVVSWSTSGGGSVQELSYMVVGEA